MATRLLLACMALSLALVGPAGAAEIGLTSVLYPEGKSIDVPIAGTQRAPAAEINAEVEHRAGQSIIEIDYKDLPPAVLFGGDFVSYVVWAVTKDGTAENLGGIANEDDKGDVRFSTASRDFALMITAEPIATVHSPGDLVVFFSGTPAGKNIVPTGFTFGGLSTREGLVTRENESIAGKVYDRDKTNPLPLIQAEKAGELLDRFDAQKHDPEAYEMAMAALMEARDEKGRKQLDASRRTVEFAGQALHKTARMMEAEEAAMRAAEAAAARQQLGAETTSLKDELMASRKRLELTEAKLTSAEIKLQTAEAELMTTRAETEKMESSYDAVSAQLSKAQGQMATGAKTDRGFVVSLSGTAFPSGKSTLTTDAKYVLAKLSGMLLALPKAKLTVAGHTDATGSDELNQKLSVARAAAVEMFLTEMGVDGMQISSSGFGPTHPIAPNDTPEGRAKNRRVEIILGGM